MHKDSIVRQRKLQNERIQFCYKLKRFIIWVESVGDYSNISSSDLLKLKNEYLTLLAEKSAFFKKRRYKKEVRYSVVIKETFVCPFCGEKKRAARNADKGVSCKCGARAVYKKKIKLYRITLKVNKT